MRFIPKKKEILTESDVNPLDINNVDLSYDESYKQAILAAIASETAAFNEYDQILSLESKVTERSLVDNFHDTIVDIRDEEMKHLAQLTTKISNVDQMKDAYEAGKKEAETNKEQPAEEKSEESNEETQENTKEEVKESVQVLTEAVQKDRTYDNWQVSQIISKALNLNDRQFEYVENEFRLYEDEMTAEEVDRALANLSEIFNISDAKLDNIENQIIATENPIESRKEEFKSDIGSDISILENAMDNVYSVAAKEKLYAAIQYLKELQYDGDKDTGWTTQHSAFNGKYNKKRIVA